MNILPRMVASLLALASSLSAGTAAAQETYKLRFNHVLGPTEPFHEGFLAWAEAVKARTNGGLIIDVFHSAQLGVEEDIIEQVRQGSNVGQNTDAARLGNYVPSLAVLNGPYMQRSLDDVAKLSSSATVKQWLDELSSLQGIKVVCFDWVQGFRHFFTNEPVTNPEELAGLRIRTPPAPIWQESIRALGASPTAMAFGEMYPALQQQAIDGVELVYNNIPGGRFYEVLSHVNETEHILLTNFQVVSAQWFDSLPAEYQSALVEECSVAGRATSTRIAELEQQVKADLISRGMTVTENIDLDAFRTAADAAYEALGLAEAKAAVQAELGKAAQ
ncbi:C4-dicarboxylate TRAP transporter substrate-binding protein [Corticibacterium sp. UT-5YL-CI-8]|nr:C4-dicarboxylate TRAP transporter substrate-binding protein [Tianweitania sp. UT-5YL-CI-8]